LIIGIFLIIPPKPLDFEFKRGIMPHRRACMGKHIIQIPSADGCTYVYDTDEKTLQKICDIGSAKDIPEDVKETLRTARLYVVFDKTSDSHRGFV
jgi:hypothetical protein